jgi:hypothetical protein
MKLLYPGELITEIKKNEEKKAKEAAAPKFVPQRMMIGGVIHRKIWKKQEDNDCNIIKKTEWVPETPDMDPVICVPQDAEENRNYGESMASIWASIKED